MGDLLMAIHRPTVARPTATRPTVRRNRRVSRWLHALVYSCSLLLLATGVWLLLGQEGNPSPLAHAIGRPDVVVHRWLGYALLAIALAGLVVWRRDLRRFGAETFRWDRGDRAWLASWPKAALTGGFRRHEGQFDPGQRLANIVLVGTLVLLLVSGIGLVQLHGGTLFVWLYRVHLWSTYAFGTMLVGHVVVASGILPGYRGVWRAMHLGGHLPEHVAARLWPAWFDAHPHSDGDTDVDVPSGSRPVRHDLRGLDDDPRH